MHIGFIIPHSVRICTKKDLQPLFNFKVIIWHHAYSKRHNERTRKKTAELQENMEFGGFDLHFSVIPTLSCRLCGTQSRGPDSFYSCAPQ